MIEMLVVMIESLRLAHRDDKSLGTYMYATLCSINIAAEGRHV